MADHLRKFRRDDSRPLDAALLNDLIDAAREVRSSRLDSPRAIPSEGIYSPVVVRIKNSSGGDLERRSIVKLGDPWIAADDSQDDFEAFPGFEGETPDATDNQFAVLLTNLPDGETGPAVIAGISAVQINVTDTGHRFATPTAADATQMTSAATGSAVILPPTPTGTGTQWCYVLLLGGTSLSGGSGMTIAEQDGSPSYTDVTSLTVDQDDGFVLTQPGGVGTARLDMSAATASQAGNVSTGTQTFGGDKTFLGSLTVGSASQSATCTVNFYGASGVLTTINWQTYTTQNYYGGNNYKSSSSSSYEAGSTTTYNASATLTLNNRPTFNNALILVDISLPSSPDDGTLFLLNNKLMWWCDGEAAFKFPPSAPAKPNLENQLKVSFPPYSTTPGDRTSGTTPTLTLTDTNSNVTTEKIPGTSMVGFKFPGDLTNRTLSIQDTGNIFDGYTGGTIPTWRMRTWFYLIDDPSAGGVDLITLGTPQFAVSAITSGTTFLVITVHGSPTEQFNDGTSLSLNTLYSLEVWLDPSVGTNGTWYSSVNGAAPTSHAASNGFVNGGGFQSTLTLGAGATTRGYYLGPVEILYSLPSGTDSADWYNGGSPLAYPYATGTTPMQAGSTGADLSQTGGPGSVLYQPSAGQGVTSGPLPQNADTPFGRIKGYESGI